MSALLKAADDLKVVAVKLKGFIAVAEALEKIGSIEQAENEAKVRKEKAVQDEIAAVKRLEHLGFELKVMEDKIGEARQAALSVEQAAAIKASDIVKDAQDQAQSIVSESVKRKAQLAAEIQVLAAEYRAGKESVDSVKQELELYKSKVDEVKKQLAAFLK